VNVLVDTSAWSLALRRSASPADPVVVNLRELIEESRAHLIGPIRQEILSGIREQAQYEVLRDTLRSFPDLEILSADYERAAEMFNQCRRQGLQGSNTDFLICAVAERLNLSILTTDQDFQLFQAHIPLTLYAVSDES
jgi:predicted nucleic acid-binding protein